MELREVEKKIVLIGDAKTGKTAIAERFANDRFVEEYVPGTGVKVYRKKLQYVYPNILINLKIAIFDLCGQRDYERIREMALTDADALVFVSDLSRVETISAIPEFWVIEAKKADAEAALVYLGNKIDLVNEESPTAKLLTRIADERGIPIFFCSAKTGENVEELFQFIGKRLVSEVARSYKKPQKEKPMNLTNAFDYILADFCAQHGDMEKAMLIAQNQFLEIGLDLRKLTKEKVIEMLERLRMVESILLSENIARVNYDERLKLVNSVAAE